MADIHRMALDRRVGHRADALAPAHRLLGRHPHQGGPAGPSAAQPRRDGRHEDGHRAQGGRSPSSSARPSSSATCPSGRSREEAQIGPRPGQRRRGNGHVVRGGRHPGRGPGHGPQVHLRIRPQPLQRRPRRTSERVDAIEIKFGQSAKPGMGGHLPGAKVTAEIAAVRGFPRGRTSSARRASPTSPRATTSSARSTSCGRSPRAGPIGVKFAAGHVEADLEFALSAGPDFITIDGRAGATGAAVKLIKDATSIPTIYALDRARRYLDGAGHQGRDAHRHRRPARLVGFRQGPGPRRGRRGHRHRGPHGHRLSAVPDLRHRPLSRSASPPRTRACGPGSTSTKRPAGWPISCASRPRSSRISPGSPATTASTSSRSATSSRRTPRSRTTPRSPTPEGAVHRVPGLAENARPFVTSLPI